MTEGFAVLGAHGGAGARTVAAMLQVSGAKVEVVPRGDAVPEAATPVLVCRSTAAGLAAAAERLVDWPAHVPRPWLVVMADVPAPASPRVRYRVRALADQVRGMVEVPYLWPLRTANWPGDLMDAKVVAKMSRELADAFSVGTVVER